MTFTSRKRVSSKHDISYAILNLLPVQLYMQSPSCLSPLFQSESWYEAFHMEISFIHTQILIHLLVNFN